MKGLLNFTPTPTSTTMSLLLFCIAFGLSMDYEVFLLSRSKELHDAGASNEEAVAGGLARTGRIVTTAAALLAVTWWAPPALRRLHRRIALTELVPLVEGVRP